VDEKTSLRALRELHAEYERKSGNGQRRDQERADLILFDFADAIPALLSIAEAALGVKEVFPNSHPDRCLCNPCVKHKHLRAALAEVED